MLLTATETGAIYSCVEHCLIRQYPINHEGIEEFCTRLRELEGGAGEEAKGHYWQDALRYLRRVRFEALNVPVPFKRLPSMDSAAREAAVARLELAGQAYPQLEHEAVSLRESFYTLAQSNDSPLLDRVVSILESTGAARKAIGLVESRFLGLLDEILQGHPSLRGTRTLAPFELRGASAPGLLVVVGAMTLYPGFVFAAPRSPEVAVVRFSCVRDQPPPRRVFVGREGAGKAGDLSAVGRSPRGIDYSALPGQGGWIVDSGETESVNWRQMRDKASDLGEGDPQEELVEARLCLLEGGLGVFVDADPDSHVLVIDLGGECDDEDGANGSPLGGFVGRTHVSELRPGQFVLLRTAGGGDAVAFVAEKILGRRAERANELQALWKAGLRKEVQGGGIGEAVKKLEHLGCGRAGEGNVRNWQSIRNIRPRDRSDFDAILQLVGLRGRSDELWENAAVIHRAHRRAGVVIRQLLLQRVGLTDLAELERLGRKEFAFEDGHGGSITAFRILQIDPSTDVQPLSRLGRPFISEE